MNARSTLLLALGLGACAFTSDVPPATVVGEESLGLVDAQGIAIDEAGTRFLLTGDGRVEERVDGTWLRRFHAPPGRYFDLAHVEGDRFAITAPNMGHGLELGTRLFTSWFCYFPEDESVREEQPPTNGQPTEEIARAVAYDARNDFVFAQPQTSELDTGRGTFSELAIFTAADGTEQLFRNLGDASFAAGGMVVLDSDDVGAELLLGRGTMLVYATFPEVTRRDVFDLRSLGVRDIRGLAIDREGGVLEVLDQRGDEAVLVTLDLDVVLAATR
ncbi:MAG: hypothetical protein H6721_31300 [Sandaracinus sp.]|nr:hypothetical protein [Sandaracinus sp.]MCB9613122.1 hypothetical protein [Sandaracinus sp.]MCB9636619.1 hypothetical protein [Sandaracinus sp.]